MKIPPRPGEMRLTHVTTQTGDVQSFGVNAKNFNPLVIAQVVALMRPNPPIIHSWTEDAATGAALMGYRLEVKQLKETLVFIVAREDGAQLTYNSVTLENHTIMLVTSILTAAMSPAEAEMLADLEQCAALALLEITPV